MKVRRRRLSSTSPRKHRIGSKKWGMVALWHTGMNGRCMNMVESKDFTHLLMRSRFWRVVIPPAESSIDERIAYRSILKARAEALFRCQRCRISSHHANVTKANVCQERRNKLTSCRHVIKGKGVTDG